jgi:hypothetical protein
MQPAKELTLADLEGMPFITSMSDRIRSCDTVSQPVTAQIVSNLLSALNILRGIVASTFMREEKVSSMLSPRAKSYHHGRQTA